MFLAAMLVGWTEKLIYAHDVSNDACYCDVCAKVEVLPFLRMQYEQTKGHNHNRMHLKRQNIPFI